MQKGGKFCLFFQILITTTTTATLVSIFTTRKKVIAIEKKGILKVLASI